MNKKEKNEIKEKSKDDVLLLLRPKKLTAEGYQRRYMKLMNSKKSKKGSL